MLEQQAKEMPRRDDATSEPVDETLSVVRQLMAAQSRPAAPPPNPSAPHKPEAASAPGMPVAQKRREKLVRGRAALPDLEMSEPVSPRIWQVRSVTAPAKALCAALWRRLGGPGLRGTARSEADSLSVPGEAWGGRLQAMPEAMPEAGPALSVPGQRTLVQAIREFRPTRKQIVLVVLIGLMVWRPWLIPGLLFVAFWVALIAYLTLGTDRVAEIADDRWQWFSARFPERAERLLTRAQRGADRLDGWMAWLPESWTDGIYLPDLGRSQSEPGPAEQQPDPFDRLAAQQQVMSRRRASAPKEHGRAWAGPTRERFRAGKPDGSARQN